MSQSPSSDRKKQPVAQLNGFAFQQHVYLSAVPVRTWESDEFLRQGRRSKLCDGTPR